MLSVFKSDANIECFAVSFKEIRLKSQKYCCAFFITHVIRDKNIQVIAKSDN
jgi:hypothetical protein